MFAFGHCVYVHAFSDPEEVLEWLLKHKAAPSIEDVTDKMLAVLIGSHEYVGVFFRGKMCDKEVEESKNDDEFDCDSALAELETIDDELDNMGIILVTTNDMEIAKENGITVICTCTLCTVMQTIIN